MKKNGIVFMDGIVQAKRVKGGYRLEVIAGSGQNPRDSLFAAAMTIVRDVEASLAKPTVELVPEAAEERSVA